MSIFEEWAKPFPKLTPAAYHIEPCGYWEDLVIVCKDLPTRSSWAIEFANGLFVLSKKRLEFIPTHGTNLWENKYRNDLRFPSNIAAGDFYQEHLEEINKSHHKHPEHKQTRCK